jgi:signal transduction histidine kinase
MKPAGWACLRADRANAAGALLLCALLQLAPIAHAVDDVQLLDRAEFLLSDSAGPPPDGAAWQHRTLPDGWTDSRSAMSSSTWYRFRVELPAQPEHPQALYVPMLRPGGAIHVNGYYIGRTGPPGAGGGRSQAHTFAVPPHLLHSGANTVHVRVFANATPFGTSLWPLEIGPDVALNERLVERRFWESTAPTFAMGFSSFVGLFVLALWSKRRHEALYGYFGLSALARLVFVAYGVTAAPLLPPSLWFAIYGAAIGFGPVLMALFSLRYGGWRLPRTERALWAFAGLAPVLFYLTFVGVLDRSVVTWGVAAAYMVSASSVAILVLAARQQRGVQGWLLALTALLNLVVGLYGTYGDLTALGVSEESVHAFRIVPLYVVVTWVLIGRFAKSLDEAERLNVELEQRVEDRRVELQANYDKLRTLEQQQAVVAERARIMSDMHDGIGGQLISTLSLVEHGEGSTDQVASALRECIDDLRIAIDSLEPTDDDLLPVLGNLRYRLEPRLKANGIALDWRVRDVPKLACLTPQNVLHVLRILQEAFTNVLKHAQARHIRVDTRVDEGRVSIRVSDDGKGFDVHASTPGHGLASMHRRARTIGADLQVAPSASGTTLSLRLPMG